MEEKDIQILKEMFRESEARMENKMEARIFFDSVLQPPEVLSAKIAELKKEFDELNRELYREILDSIQLRDRITYDDAMKYFIMLQDMFNHSFSSQNCQNVY